MWLRTMNYFTSPATLNCQVIIFWWAAAEHQFRRLIAPPFKSTERILCLLYKATNIQGLVTLLFTQWHEPLKFINSLWPCVLAKIPSWSRWTKFTTFKCQTWTWSMVLALPKGCEQLMTGAKSSATATHSMTQLTDIGYWSSYQSKSTYCVPWNPMMWVFADQRFSVGCVAGHQRHEWCQTTQFFGQNDVAWGNPSCGARIIDMITHPCWLTW